MRHRMDTTCHQNVRLVGDVCYNRNVAELEQTSRPVKIFKNL